MMVRNTGMPLCNISPTEKIILDLISFFILWAGTKLKVADPNIMPNARYLSPRKRSVGEALNNTKRAEMFFARVSSTLIIVFFFFFVNVFVFRLAPASIFFIQRLANFGD